MNYFQIGSMSIPSTWLSASVALFAAALIFRVIAGKKVGEWYWNSFFLYFFVWKLSYIPFHLNMFLDMPLSLIYFNGGSKGHLVALAVLSLYFLLIVRKKYQTEVVPTLFLLYFICYELLNYLLEKSRIEAILQLVLLLSYVLFLKRNIITKKLFIILLLLYLLILSFFGTIFSVEKLTFIWLGLLALTLSKENSQISKP